MLRTATAAARFLCMGPRGGRWTHGCGAGKALRSLHDVLFGVRNRRTEEACRTRLPRPPHRRGRTIYVDRPQICRGFACDWLGRRELPPHFRPDLVGAILMEDADSDEFWAVRAPERPTAWRNPRAFAHPVAAAKSGRTVVAKAGLLSRRIFASGAWAPSV